jgi:hypothetical protein
MNATTTAHRNAATERQVAFILSMLVEILGNESDAQIVLDRNVSRGLLADRARVSAAIDALIVKRDAHRSEIASRGKVLTVEPGFVYYSAQGIVRVVKGRQSGNVYAEVLRDGTFHYTRGAITQLERDNTARRMTLDEAKKESVLFGSCIRCNATLVPDKKTGEQRFIGPVCIKFFD